jgi:hypothetical protein
MTDMYNLYYNNVKVNSKPLNLLDAQYEAGLILINYGYKPTLVKVLNR